jgi:hypothetical protein
VAAAAVGIGTAVRFAPLPAAPIIRAIAILGSFGATYLLISATFTDEGRRMLAKLRSLLAV